MTLTTARIAITPGEPAGIGPDIVLALAQQDWPLEWVCIADPHLMADRARQLGLPITIKEVEADYCTHAQVAGELKVLPVACRAPVKAGQLDPANARYVLDCLDLAVQDCLEGRLAALVTGPVHKGIINQAGIPFTGHTEWLASRSHTDKVVMMLATEGLRVALATTHLPLRQVAEAIDASELRAVLNILQADLQTKFGIESPRIAVLGLNPHAGEDGHLGREEIDIIIPLLAELREAGMQLIGPLPADTLFLRASQGAFDGVVAMYHDQGHIPVKLLGMHRAVNITLGLPIVRTSVAHGTAFDIVGTGTADPSSMRAAIDMAIRLVAAGWPVATAAADRGA